MIKGFDCSDSDDIKWDKISPDFKFVMIKKSEGATFTAKTYAYRTNYLKTSELVWFDYHFMKPNISVQSQLDNYFTNRKAITNPILDAEVEGITPEMVIEWLAEAESRTGLKPILYCDPGFYKDNLKSTQFDCLYWIAAWQPEPPHIHWNIWQYSEYGRQDGTHGNSNEYGSLDLNYFNGTFDELKTLANL